MSLKDFYRRRHELTLTVVCEKCNAQPGVECVSSPGGNRTLTPHYWRRLRGSYLHQVETGAILRPHNRRKVE